MPEESIIVSYPLLRVDDFLRAGVNNLVNETLDYPSHCEQRIEMIVDDNLVLQNKSKVKIVVQANGLPIELNHIFTTIEESRYILNLKDNWDDEGAISIPELVFNRAILFLKEYSKRTYDLFDVVIQAPLIQPLADGSIDLEWDTEHASLLINFKNTKNDIAFYYGEIINKNNKKFDFNGEISTDIIEDTFVSWFKNLS